MFRRLCMGNAEQALK